MYSISSLVKACPTSQGGCLSRIMSAPRGNLCKAVKGHLQWYSKDVLHRQGFWKTIFKDNPNNRSKKSRHQLTDLYVDIADAYINSGTSLRLQDTYLCLKNHWKSDPPSHVSHNSSAARPLRLPYNNPVNITIEIYSMPKLNPAIFRTPLRGTCKGGGGQCFSSISIY